MDARVKHSAAWRGTLPCAGPNANDATLHKQQKVNVVSMHDLYRSKDDAGHRKNRPRGLLPDLFVHIEIKLLLGLVGVERDVEYPQLIVRCQHEQMRFAATTPRDQQGQCSGCSGEQQTFAGATTLARCAAL